MDKYSHRERLEMIIAGERPDRFAASFWRHFFHLENNAEGTADAMLRFQKHFDWDFMKINPRADYHVQDWGMKLEYSREEFTKHRKLEFPIKSPDDWMRLEALPLTAPALAEHLKAMSLIKRGSDAHLPLLMTIFTPISIAGRMVPSHDILLEHIRTAPDKVEQGLKIITETFAAFATELRNAGADGLFYATTHWASSDKLTWEEYRRFGLPYDRPVIEAAGEDALNLLHVCASNCYLTELVNENFPAALYNWDSSDPTNLPVDKAMEQLEDIAIVGGVDDKGWLWHGTAAEVGHQIDELKTRFDPSRVILGPDCAIAPEIPVENLEIIRSML